MATYRLRVGDKIKAQAAFWRDDSKVRAYVGGIGSGKTFAGAIAVLQAPAGTTGMVVAPTYPILRDAAQALFFELCPPALIVSHNKSEGKTVLANGTIILWRSCDRPDSLRGPNLHWAWGDEWAYASEDAHKVVIGRLRRGAGRFWITTTPNGQNWLHQWAVVRKLGYSVHFGTTQQNIHLPKDYLADLQVAYADDPEYALQELEGKFVDLSGSKRIPSLLLEAVRADMEPLQVSCPLVVNGVQGSYAALEARIYATPQRSHSYVIGADPAEGVRGGDDSAAVVLDVTTGVVVAILSGEYEPTDVFPGHLAALARWYNAPVMVERNNHGHAVIGGLGLHGVRLLSGDASGRLGWQTTAKSKADMYRAGHAALLDARRRHYSVIHDATLAEQIKCIDRKTLKAPGKAKSTKVDDLAVAWALACAAAEQLRVADVQIPEEAPISNILQPPTAW